MAIALITDVINTYIYINPVWMHTPAIGMDLDTLYHHLSTIWGMFPGTKQEHLCPGAAPPCQDTHLLHRATEAVPHQLLL